MFLPTMTDWFVERQERTRRPCVYKVYIKMAVMYVFFIEYDIEQHHILDSV